MAYKLELTNDEADAIFWHGHRYSVSELLTRKLHQNDAETAWEADFAEHEAWALKDLWDDEGPLSCGSRELNGKLQTFIDRIV